jgi:glutamine kinase
MRVNQSIFGTKAETLDRLLEHPTNFEIPKFVFFSEKEWSTNRMGLLNQIQDEFSKTEVAVRSSAQNEDSAFESKAGQFQSILNVSTSNQVELSQAINSVFNSFENNFDNQVIVQTMIRHAAVSGVIMTRNIDDGSPYYVICYDDVSGKTDTITSGTGISKTVLVYRKAAEYHILSNRLRAMLRLARELEGILGLAPVDIEFGISRSGQVYLFQVRRITTSFSWDEDIEFEVGRFLSQLQSLFAEIQQPRKTVAGANTVLCNMADWNPAEMIGAYPKPLAASLYRELITKDIWRLARLEMGYRNVGGEELMILFAGRCYIDVRNSINSFLPENLSPELAEKIVNKSLANLSENPSYHDKIEFEIIPTIGTFDTEIIIRKRYGDVLSDDEITQYVELLLQITRQNISLNEAGSLCSAELKIRDLQNIQSKDQRSKLNGTFNRLSRINTLIEECKRLGTYPFSILARHGFIAETFLRSLTDSEVLTKERMQEFRSSINTIAGDLVDDMHKVITSQLDVDSFMDSYGHLRPGTYDIMSKRYDQRKDLFENYHPQSAIRKHEFVLGRQERLDIQQLLQTTSLDISADDFMEYIRRSIVGREFGKFVFTRHLSTILEEIAGWGAEFELSREDLSYLDLSQIFKCRFNISGTDLAARLHDEVKAEKSNANKLRGVKLGHILRFGDDLFVVPSHRAAPNFITRSTIEAPACTIEANMDVLPALNGKIVCIENADPGFDWLFAKGIAGLVTRYGGVNSHMAIRCAEFGLPAVIGCGDLLYDEVSQASVIELNAETNVLKKVR